MRILPYAKAGCSILLFCGLMALLLSLSPKAQPTKLETSTSVVTLPETSTESVPSPVPAPIPTQATVELRGTTFVNSSVTIQAGGRVAWVHHDGMTPHTVSADDGSFDSSPNCLAAAPVPLSQVCMVEGDTFSESFSKPGTHAYHCRVHPSMTGTITVA